MITFYSIIWTLINCMIMAGIICALRTKTDFVTRYGTSVLKILTLLCIIRILFPLEFPDFQFVIADSYFYAAIYKLVQPVFSPRLPDSLMVYMFLLWIAGAVFCTYHLLKESLHTYRSIREHSREADSRVLNTLASIDPSCKLPVFICDSIAVPTLAGYLKAGIYLPGYEYTDRELHYILLHEYTHWKHKDIWKRLAMNVICIMFWWNPAVYSISSGVGHLLEFNCDRLLSRDISDREVVYYLDSIRTSYIRLEDNPQPIRTSLFTIEFVNTSKKSDVLRRFDLLMYRDTSIRKKLYPKILIVLVGLLWIFASYFFIWQSKYETPDHAMWTPNKTDLSVSRISDDSNTYLVEQKDGSYIFYFNEFSMDVPAKDVEDGLYDIYPIIEYEEEASLLQTILETIRSWLP